MLGRYQINDEAFEDLGYYDRTNKRWTGKGGMFSAEDFLDDPPTQETVVREFLRDAEKKLYGNGSFDPLGKRIDGIAANIPITRSGLLAAAHRRGPEGVKDYLDHIRRHNWISNESTFGGNRKKFLQIETRLREFSQFPLE